MTAITDGALLFPVQRTAMYPRSLRPAAALAAALLLLSARPTLATPSRFREPALPSPAAAGAPVPRTSVVESVRGGKLHVEVTYRFEDGRAAVETARFRTGVELVQEWWSYRETERGAVRRIYEVDLTAGEAYTEVRGVNGAREEWLGPVPVVRGRTFAGVGLLYAASHHRDRLVGDQEVAIQAIQIGRRPGAATVVLRAAGTERIRVGGRSVDTDRVRIAAPARWRDRLAGRPTSALVAADVWLERGRAPMIVRARQPLGDARGPVVRVDLIPAATGAGGWPGRKLHAAGRVAGGA